MGGSDWVECSAYLFLTTSSIATLILLSLLLMFQINQYGLNLNCIRKTKTRVFYLCIAFNFCLIIDLLRYPLVSYLGTTILLVLEFTFKYAAIITVSYHFIKISGALVSKK